MTGQTRGKRFRRAAAMVKKRLALSASPSTPDGASREIAPSASWSLERTVAWKRANGYPPPTPRHLEPGYAGEIDAEELDIIWRHIKQSPHMARIWGVSAQSARGNRAPKSHIRLMAMYGGTEQ